MAPDNEANNRRYFPRVKVRTHAELVDPRGENWPVHILDLSFNGALAALIHKHNLKEGEAIQLLIDSGEESGRRVRMQGRLSHIKEHFLGIECRATGIDNQTRLRELLKEYQRREGGLAERSYLDLLQDYERDQ